MFVHITELRSRGSDDPLLRNALVETFLLHIRILSEVLLEKAKNQDDILLSMLVPESTRPAALNDALNELRATFGTRKDSGSPCWEINKRLAHLTRERGPDYDYATVFRNMKPVLIKALRLIAEATSRPKLLALTRIEE